MNYIKIPEPHLPFRFATFEDAEKWLKDGDRSGAVEPFIEIDGGIKINPAYQEAPYETAIAVSS